jgi:hypothetical protein
MAALVVVFSFMVWPPKSASFDSWENFLKTMVGISFVFCAYFLWKVGDKAKWNNEQKGGGKEKCGRT